MARMRTKETSLDQDMNAVEVSRTGGTLKSKVEMDCVFEKSECDPNSTISRDECLEPEHQSKTSSPIAPIDGEDSNSMTYSRPLDRNEKERVVLQSMHTVNDFGANLHDAEDINYEMPLLVSISSESETLKFQRSALGEERVFVRPSRNPEGISGSFLSEDGSGQLLMRKCGGDLPFLSSKRTDVACDTAENVFVRLVSLADFVGDVSLRKSEWFLPRVDSAASFLPKTHTESPKSLSVSEESGQESCATLLESLNPQQITAVTSEVNRACLVLAGPGSGKTRVLTHRAAFLCRRYNLNPSRILAVTFTNKAAEEMKSRLNSLLLDENVCNDRLSRSEIAGGTFHSICARILRLHGDCIGIPSDFQICDAVDAKSIVVSLLKKKTGSDGKSSVASSEAVILLKQISRLKNHAESEMKSVYAPHVYAKVVEFRKQYDSELRRMNQLDFDDLLLETRRLLETSEETLQELQRRYQHILVDEWQDTNVVQFDIVSKLAEKHSNLFVVGDDDQAIFKFRGADVRNLQRFMETFPGRQEIRLETNYRSSGCIVDSAQSVIQANRTRPKKVMRTSNPQGTPLVVCNAYDDRHEAWYVVKTAKELLRNRRISSLDDVAVLYRTNMQSRVLEEACIQASLPYRIVGGTRFYDRLEVKDVMSYVRLTVNPADDLAFLRAIKAPTRGIGAKTVDALRDLANKHQVSLFRMLETIVDAHESADNKFPKGTLNKLVGFFDVIRKLRSVSSDICLGAKDGDELPKSAMRLVSEILHLTDYKAYLEKRTKVEDTGEGLNKFEEKWLNLLELKSAASCFATPQEFLQSVSLLALPSDADGESNGAKNALTFLTLHSAKGLEFDAVFMVGVEEGTLPMIRSHELMNTQGNEEIEEERRLMFVGMTRAKKYLLISHRSRSLSYVRSGPFFRSCKPSRFLQDIPDKLISYVRAYSNRSRVNDRTRLS